MVQGPGVGAKAAMTSGFVSMFRQAQHIAGSTNCGLRKSLSLPKDVATSAESSYMEFPFESEPSTGCVGATSRGP